MCHRYASMADLRAPGSSHAGATLVTGLLGKANPWLGEIASRETMLLLLRYAGIQLYAQLSPALQRHGGIPREIFVSLLQTAPHLLFPLCVLWGVFWLSGKRRPHQTVEMVSQVSPPPRTPGLAVQKTHHSARIRAIFPPAWTSQGLTGLLGASTRL